MAPEITESEDQNPPSIQQKVAEKIKIRQIIDYQKSLHFSSCSSSSSSSSFSTSSKSSRLYLMREGSAPLRRLFDMEHTSLQKYFKDYSVLHLKLGLFFFGEVTSMIMKFIVIHGPDSDLDSEIVNGNILHKKVVAMKENNWKIWEEEEDFIELVLTRNCQELVFGDVGGLDLS